jgi:hypothetical protein
MYAIWNKRAKVWLEVFTEAHSYKCNETKLLSDPKELASYAKSMIGGNWKIDYKIRKVEIKEVS